MSGRFNSAESSLIIGIGPISAELIRTVLSFDMFGFISIDSSSGLCILAVFGSWMACRVLFLLNSPVEFSLSRLLALLRETIS